MTTCLNAGQQRGAAARGSSAGTKHQGKAAKYQKRHISSASFLFIAIRQLLASYRQSFYPLSLLLILAAFPTPEMATVAPGPSGPPPPRPPDPDGHQPPDIPDLPLDGQYCEKCKTTKPLSQFINLRDKTKLTRYCLACRNRSNAPVSTT